jgi:circadian clock protein KaiB
VKRRKGTGNSNGNEPGKNGQESGKPKFFLRLYVTGSTPRSVKSIENLKTFCEKHLKGDYEMEVIDIYQQPALASENQIIAAPTLIKSLPLPLRRLVGDLSNQDRVLSGLDLKIAQGWKQ